MSSSIASLVTVLGLWAFLAFFCCGGSGQIYDVTYRVDGTGRASLTYSNASGGTEQQDVDLPWEKKLNVTSGEFLYVSAQNKEERGTIVATIYVNGRIVKDAVSSGGYTIATASARCCE